MSRVLLDCDGVLGDFASEVVTWANSVTGKAYSLEDFTSFDLLEPIGLTHLQAELDWYLFSINHCGNMPVYPGAVEFVDAIRAAGHEIVVVTSPYEAVPNWCSERTKWLKRHFGISKHDVIFAKRKELVVGDFLVDDKTQNCEGFNAKSEGRHNNEGGFAVCIARPWNHDFMGGRAETYAEALEILT